MVLNLIHIFEAELTATVLPLLGLGALILFVAFFVAAELSLVAASPEKIAQWTHQTANPLKVKAAIAVQKAQKDLPHYFSVTQTGTTAGSLLLGWLGEGTTVHWLDRGLGWLPLGKLPMSITSHAIAVIVAFFLITYVEILLGELVPKVLATNAPEKTALLLIRPLQICDYLLSPFLFLLNGNVRLLTGWLTRKIPELSTKESCRSVVSPSAPVMDLTIELTSMTDPIPVGNDIRPH